MKLTDLKCKNAKYNPKRNKKGEREGNKLADGGGLYLHIKESGKYWHFKYRFLGKEKLLSFGKYPLPTSLLEAREMRDEAKKLLFNGQDPALVRKTQKLELELSYENNFESLARKWHEQNKYTWQPKHAQMILRRFETKIFPSIGKLPIKEITAPELLAAVEKVQDKGNHDLAHRMMQMCSKVFRFAVARGLCTRDITYDLRGALVAVKSKHLAYLPEKELPDFLSKLDKYEEYGGSILTKLAFQLLILTFVRSGEIRGAKWDEIDFDKALWRIPADRMKMKTEHLVPLSKQSINILRQIHKITGHNMFGLIFPSKKEPNKIMSENTFLRAIEVLGYKGKTVAHGFRSTASTILNENGFESVWIERQLAHEERDQVKAIYDHSQHIEKRRIMMQWWGDYIEHGAAPLNFDNIVKFSKKK